MRHPVDRPHPPRHTVIGRRTILHGAAWSVPAIALVTAVPAYAQSGKTLSFSSASFTGPACGTITDATVRAASGGAPASGVNVALSLSGGFTFDGGGSSATVVTGSDGSVSCGTIHVPAAGTSGTLSASSADASGASAGLGSADAQVFTSPRGLATVSGIPVGSTPLTRDFFLSGTSLYRAGAGVVATGIRSAGRLVESSAGGGSFLLPVQLTDASASVFDTASGALIAASGTPSGATPLAGDLFLSGNTVYRGGVAVATDVAEAGQLIPHDDGSGSSSRLYLPYRSVTGEPRILRVPDNDVRTAFEYGSSNGPASGATPVADDLFLSSNSLYRVSWDGTSAYGTGAVASGIKTTGSLTPNPYYAGERLLPVSLSGSGDAALFMVSGNSLRAARQVPSVSTPLGADLFFSSGTVYQDGTGAVASSIAHTGLAGPVSSGSNKVSIPLINSASC